VARPDIDVAAGYLLFLKRAELPKQCRVVQELDLTLNEQMFQVAEKLSTRVDSEGEFVIVDTQLLKMLLDYRGAILVA
jgi:hypothetical protein